jgi:hypothetical protein
MQQSQPRPEEEEEEEEKLNKHIQTIRLFMKLHSSAKHKPCLKQQQAFHRMKGRNRKQVLPLDEHTPR